MVNLNFEYESRTYHEERCKQLVSTDQQAKKKDRSLRTPVKSYVYLVWICFVFLLASGCVQPGTSTPLQGIGQGAGTILSGDTAVEPMSVSQATAGGESILLDDFESGELANWSVYHRGAGAWFVYANGSIPPDLSRSDPNVPFNVPDPSQGKFAAVTDMDGPGTRILYKNLEIDRPYTLRLTLFYVNGAEFFSSPDTLSHEITEANQQFRIDLVTPSAPIDSLAEGDVLATFFQTSPGDPNRLEPQVLAFDLSPWVGQTVRIRLATSDNRGPLRTGVDEIRLEPSAGPPSTAATELDSLTQPTGDNMATDIHQAAHTKIRARIVAAVAKEFGIEQTPGLQMELGPETDTWLSLPPDFAKTEVTDERIVATVEQAFGIKFGQGLQVRFSDDQHGADIWLPIPSDFLQGELSDTEIQAVSGRSIMIRWDILPGKVLAAAEPGELLLIGVGIFPARFLSD